MTQEANQPSSLTQWWESVSFSGKENYRLNDDGHLEQNNVGSLKGRSISPLSETTADITLKALTDKFAEVEAKWKELENEWNTSEEKLKLVGKVERMKDYLQHTAAVGAINVIEKSLAALEAEVNTLVEANHKLKLELAQEAETLAKSEQWKETTQHFKDLAEKWKKIGYLDKHRNDELWNRIEAAKNAFFDRKRQNQEDVNKEMLQNLDLKLEMVEKAEALAASENWKEATEAFHNLMEQWKQTGRTMHDKNEELWHRFITAKNTFFEKKKGHFDTIQAEQETNMAAKLSLIEKAEALQNSTDWGNTAQAFTELMDQWKSIGRVPADKADELWNKFIGAKEAFFKAKKAHSENLKVSLQDNYAQKLALLKRAESLQHSNQWREATDEMMELMETWKKIGPVPREFNNEIWEKFNAARKKFFQRKDANREHRKQLAEKHKHQRVQQTYDFVQKLEDELREEQERLADFKEGILNITPGRKEAELRTHLEKLIAQTEHKIEHKTEKLAEARKQLQELEEKAQQETAANPQQEAE
ncbi:MAG: DUF349 domain-containing protein [Bacteroidetes bacterium]|nr:DUF349 domain-containing protein [Bacteroidota bacterium]